MTINSSQDYLNYENIGFLKSISVFLDFNIFHPIQFVLSSGLPDYHLIATRVLPIRKVAGNQLQTIFAIHSHLVVESTRSHKTFKS
ncbi:hypothetical protein CLV99_1852 [Sphingobacterium yanglingense]|uniref:Uncharacterized protein n=1 Tax=Sphingobacterium yanglingense TaxID=1437280 RepID=A0A4R6WDS8_9SPHI|nr:hypothetical protein CLV99_1852 [Sphingobacterium yanglingense]